jgi:hypothetical protein
MVLPFLSIFFNAFIHFSLLGDDAFSLDHQTPSGTPGLLLNAPNHSFKEFLSQHIELALSKGFDDNMGRNPVPPVFEASRRSQFSAFFSLYNCFF